MRTFGLRSWHAAEHAPVVRAAGAGKLTPSLRGAEISKSEHVAIDGRLLQVLQARKRRNEGTHAARFTVTTGIYPKYR